MPIALSQVNEIAKPLVFSGLSWLEFKTIEPILRINKIFCTLIRLFADFKYVPLEIFPQLRSAKSRQREYILP